MHAGSNSPQKSKLKTNALCTTAPDDAARIYQSLIKADLEEIGTSIHIHDIQRYLNSFEKPTYCKKATQYDMDARKCHQVMYEFVMEENFIRATSVVKL